MFVSWFREAILSNRTCAFSLSQQGAFAFGKKFSFVCRSQLSRKNFCKFLASLRSQLFQNIEILVLRTKKELGRENSQLKRRLGSAKALRKFPPFFPDCFLASLQKKKVLCTKKCKTVEKAFSGHFSEFFDWQSFYLARLALGRSATRHEVDFFSF